MTKLRKMMEYESWLIGYGQEDLKKRRLKLTWLKEVAPSTELRKWFSHDPSRWKEFCKKYTQELTNDNEKGKALMELAKLASRGILP